MSKRPDICTAFGASPSGAILFSANVLHSTPHQAPVPDPPVPDPPVPDPPVSASPVSAAGGVIPPAFVSHSAGACSTRRQAVYWRWAAQPGGRR
jgi:hypothetical protein